MRYICVDRDGSCMNKVKVEELEYFEKMSLNDFEQTLEPSEFYTTINGPAKVVMLEEDLEEPVVESILELSKGETLDILVSNKKHTSYNSDAFYLLIKDENSNIIGRYEMREEPFQVETSDIEEWFGEEAEFCDVIQQQTSVDIENAILFTHA